MDEKKSQENQSNQMKSNNRTPIFIVITSLLLAIIGLLYYQKQQLGEEKDKQLQEILLTNLKIDSIGNELDARIQTILELGGEVDTLQALKMQLEEDKRQLFNRNKNQRNLIAKLNNRVDGYKDLLIMKDKEIIQLKILNKQLSTENTVLKVEKNKLNETVQELKQNKEELVGKVAFASRLQIKDMQVNAINNKGKERNGGVYRNRQINTLKIQFTVIENEIAPIEGKELLLRVIAPDGNVLFDVTKGSGSFTYKSRELFYTAKQKILYDRKSQLITFRYEKGNDYDIGQHKIEVYTDDYFMGKGVFMIK